MTTVEVERPPLMSVGSGAAIVAVTAGLLALNRFGGLAATAPRAFLRLSLIVVWGWVGLAIAIWVISGLIARQPLDPPRLATALAAVGRSHLPMIGLALVLFVAAGALQLRWPGLVATVVVLGWFFPATLARSATTGGLTRPKVAPIVAAVIAPYALWIATVGLHLNTQLGHLI